MVARSLPLLRGLSKPRAWASRGRQGEGRHGPIQLPSSLDCGWPSLTPLAPEGRVSRGAPEASHGWLLHGGTPSRSAAVVASCHTCGRVQALHRFSEHRVRTRAGTRLAGDDKQSAGLVRPPLGLLPVQWPGSAQSRP
eukprot:scaffold255_cov264-Prasinococcus_capsulatus_cf.AAC.6